MDPMLGEIRLLPFTFAPVGWLACQGQVLNIEENAALFSLLGTMFGGDGQRTYALPDLRAHSPLSGIDGPIGYCICVNGVFPSRD
jgi:microcystin-dependent protein